MPVNRPRRIRVIIILILILDRARIDLENEIDNGVWEVGADRAGRVMQMFAETVETSWTAEQIAVGKAFEDLDTYLSSTDEPDEETVETLSDTLDVALVAAGY